LKIEVKKKIDVILDCRLTEPLNFGRQRAENRFFARGRKRMVREKHLAMRVPSSSLIVARAGGIRRVQRNRMLRMSCGKYLRNHAWSRSTALSGP
jgi:hypothetical protein